MDKLDLSRHLEPLSIALKLEEEGRQFFREAAGRFESQLARQTFEFLAAEEDRHIERIREFYGSIESSGETHLPASTGPSAEQRLRSFNERLAALREEIKPSASDIEAYEYGLRFENGAEDFYRKCLQESNDPNVRRFYEWLIGEEEMHGRVLSSCLRFARDPAAWFKAHEADS
jgi:rubrerythrin